MWRVCVLLTYSLVSSINNLGGMIIPLSEQKRGKEGGGGEAQVTVQLQDIFLFR